MQFDQRYYDRVYGGAYDQRSPSYKNRALLDEIRKHRSSGRLMDIGCAYGAFLVEAARTGGFELSGTDLSQHAVDTASKRLAGFDAELRVGGLFDNGQADGSVDIACLFDVIEHIDDQDAAFAELRRILAPGGLLVLTVPVYDGPVGAVVRLLDKDPTHLHKLGRDDWLLACADQGLRVVRWLGLFRYFLAGRVYLHVRSRRLRRHSPAILLLCELETP